MPPKILVIAGPTASGKKQAALDLAERFGGEIVSADSRKVYRGLDIGTAKPSLEDRRRIPHHLIDFVDPGIPFSAGDWTEQARNAVLGILSRGRLPILSGGTGFYLKAFIEGLSEGIEPAPGVREALDRELALLGPAQFHALLAEVDPARAAELPPNDTVRVRRALEIHRTAGLTYTELKARNPPRGPAYDYFRIGISRSREELYRRCNLRVDRMIEAGLEREARSLLDAGIARDAQALDTVGYREWFAFFDGLATFEETVALIKRNTRRYAKRQLTWFKAQPGFAWYGMDEPGTMERVTAEARQWLEQER